MSQTSPPTLLRIDSSARVDGSHSRQLADWAQAAWQAAHPGGELIRRDLTTQPIGHIQAATIQGFYTPDAQMTPETRAALAQSDELIAELMGAHTLLISAPIYNFSVPSALKAWIDQVVRINRTFRFDGQGFEGLVKQPRVVLALAYGASGYAAGPMAGLDHLRPYLTSLFQFLGMTDVRVLTAEATTADANTVSSSLAAAKAQVHTLFAQEATVT
ncbi:MAG: NAD(P)H-dependent oxidoreductase [Burkholderiaceae bacterium]